MTKCFLSIFIILCSCTLIKPKTASRESSITLTNTQQTDSIMKFSEEIKFIKNGFVFVDSNFFKIMPDGTLTIKDSLVFNIGVFKRLYVGIRDTTHHGKDTSIIITN